MSNIKSLDDLNGGGSDDEKGKYNEYYAGGEKSGQVVRGAPVDDDDDEDEGDRDKVTSLFNKAKKIGHARQGTADDLPSSSKFRGSGKKLDGSAPEGEEGDRNNVVKFYKNNIFTVNDGPPRSIEDPANMEFINSVSRGECPRELDPGLTDASVTVNLLRVEEDYEMPKYVAFAGSGRTLGGSSSSGAGPSSSSQQPPAAEDTGEWAGVDESQPTTSLQLRLYDGSRMVARFNNSHTIADVGRFIRASRPDMTAQYQLTTGFPAAPVADESLTLEAAGLLNAVIIQKK